MRRPGGCGKNDGKGKKMEKVNEKVIYARIKGFEE
jgi:hypothetical protein